MVILDAAFLQDWSESLHTRQSFEVYSDLEYLHTEAS